ncbi:MAG: DUF3141 domain-containing protein [Chloroflexi bacterium]|nr:DUF3141 domain-containing protein [Chloroflexota bacterium]
MISETLRFWSELLRPYQALNWSLTNSVIFENDSLKLRSFTPLSKSNKVPILVLAPNAGHHPSICEPLLRRCLSVDVNRPVHVIDWVPPTSYSRSRFDSLDDMAANIDQCVRRLGNKVHLFTLCQGAWAGAIHTALHPESVVSYVNAAGPIDFWAGKGKIYSLCGALPMSFFENMVNMGGGVQRGECQLAGFKGLNPYDRYFGDYMDLWFAVCDDNEEKIKRWRRFKGWYDQPLNLPGVWYLEIVDKLFKRNLLVKGELEVLGKKVDLRNIKCPVFMIAGEKDDITLPEQVFAMAKYVSGMTKTKLIADAGHIGVFVKESSLKYWETSILRVLDAMDCESGVATGSDTIVLSGPA